MSNTNFSQILEALQEPFPSSEVEFKPGALNREKTKALALAYVDSRSYIQRLNLVVPDWSDEYHITMLPDRVIVLCRLSIAGVVRTGDGECLLNGGSEEDGRVEPNAVTTASAQAFKRACVKYGLGAYLYSLPQVWCDYDHAKRKIVNPPQLPDWAKPSSERQAAKEAEARQRVAAEMPAPEAPVVEGAQAGEYGEEENVGEFVIPSVFKRHGGMALKNIPRKSIEWYANEMPASSPAAKLLQAKAKAYLAKYPV